MMQVANNNLFKWDVPFQNPSDTTLSNKAKRIFTPKTYCAGNSYSNWFNVISAGTYSINNGVVAITPSVGAYGVTFPISVRGGNSYKFYCQRNATTARIGVAYYEEDGTYISGNASVNPNNSILNIPDDATIITIIFSSSGANISSSFSDITFIKV